MPPLFPAVHGDDQHSHVAEQAVSVGVLRDLVAAERLDLDLVAATIAADRLRDALTGMQAVGNQRLQPVP